MRNRERASGPGIGLAAALFLVGCAVTPAVAQEADTVSATEERPFVEGGQDDKPHLFDLAGRLAVGGYAEGHFRFGRRHHRRADVPRETIQRVLQLPGQ